MYERKVHQRNLAFTGQLHKVYQKRCAWQHNYVTLLKFFLQSVD